MFSFLLSARPQVRYLLEWTEEDLDELEDATAMDDVDFCHPLCQCPRCAPAQKVWSAPVGAARGGAGGRGLSPQEGRLLLSQRVTERLPVAVSPRGGNGESFSSGEKLGLERL